MIRGSVHAPEGNGITTRSPLAAQVELHRERHRWQKLRDATLTSAESPAELRVETDANGDFRLRVPDGGPWTVRVIAPGHLPMQHAVMPTTAVVDLPPVWPPAATSEELLVLDPRGNPVPWSWIVQKTSRLPPALEVRAAMDGWRPVPVGGWAGEDARLSFLRTPAQELELLAINQWGRERLTIGPARGEIEHGSLPDPFQVRLERATEWQAAGHENVETFLRVDGRPIARFESGLELNLSPGSLLEVAASDGTCQSLPLTESLLATGTVAVYPREPPTVSGRVVDLVGRPLRALVRLAKLGSASTGALGRSGANGEFRLRLDCGPAPDDTVLEAFAPGHLPLSRPVPLPEAEGTRADTARTAIDLDDLELEPAVLVHGVVLDPRGEPVSGVEIEARGASGIVLATDFSGTSRGRALPPPRSLAAQQLSRVRSEGDGRFLFAALSHGESYHLIARPADRPEVQETIETPATGSQGGPVIIRLREPRPVLGLVIDEAGQPVAGAAVEVLAAAALTGQRAQASPVVATTDSRGGFEIADLAAGQYLFTVQGEGFARSEELRLIPDPDPRFPMEPATLDPLVLWWPRQLTFLVTDTDQQGIENARARMLLLPRAPGDTSPLWRPWELESWPGLSDGEGILRLGDLTPGVVAAAEVSAPGFVTREIGRFEISPANDPPAVKRVVLERAASISGRIEDSRDRPLGGAHVQAVALESLHLPPDLIARSARDGSFTIAGVPAGRVRLIARAVGEAQIEPYDLELVPGEERGGVVLRVPQSAAIRGIVTSSDGPVVGATVAAGGQLEHTRHDGTFVLEPVPLGLNQLEIRSAGMRSLARSVEVTEEGAWAEIRLENELTVAGRVVDHEGRAIDRAWVSLESSSGGFSSVYTDRGGGFSFHGLEPGNLRLTARQQVLGLLPRRPQDVDADREIASLAAAEREFAIEDQSLLDLELVLQPAASIRGRIANVLEDRVFQLKVTAERNGSTDENERATLREGALPAAISWPRGPRDASRELIDATYLIAGVSAGSWKVTVFLGARSAISRSIEVPTTGTVDLDFELEDLGGVSAFGQLTVDGRPQEGIALVLMSMDVGGAAAYGNTGLEGEFELQPVEPGNYALGVAVGANAVSWQEPFALTRDTEIRLELERFRLAGRVVDGQTGDPVGGALLYLERNRGAGRSQTLGYRGRRSAQTLPDGTFRVEILTDVPPDVIRVEHPLYRTELLTRPASDGAGITLALDPIKER